MTILTRHTTLTRHSTPRPKDSRMVYRLTRIVECRVWHMVQAVVGRHVKSSSIHRCEQCLGRQVSWYYWRYQLQYPLPCLTHPGGTFSPWTCWTQQLFQHILVALHTCINNTVRNSSFGGLFWHYKILKGWMPFFDKLSSSFPYLPKIIRPFTISIFIQIQISIKKYA